MTITAAGIAIVTVLAACPVGDAFAADPAPPNTSGHSNSIASIAPAQIMALRIIPPGNPAAG